MLTNKIVRYLIIIIGIILIIFLRSPSRLDYDYINDIKQIDNEHIRITYYLDLFTNHTQYVPIDSDVVSINSFHGKNHKAYQEKSDKNSNTKTILYNKEYDFEYRIYQRTGLIARRILNYLNIEDSFKVGDKLGFIIFGSRVDIDIPINKIDKILIEKGISVNGIMKIVKLKNNENIVI